LNNPTSANVVGLIFMVAGAITLNIAGAETGRPLII
jgi:hypothetical protein